MVNLELRCQRAWQDGAALRVISVLVVLYVMLSYDVARWTE